MADDRNAMHTRRPWQIPWVRGVLAACVVGAVAAGIIQSWHYIHIYARKIIQQHDKRPLKRIVLLNTPHWLSKSLLDQIAQEAVNYTIYNPRHPDYAMQLRDPLNGTILKILARHYLQDQGVGENAWIKRITFIRRAWTPNAQIIEISAVYRQPAALVDGPTGGYMVSPGGVRLPGLYKANQLSAIQWLVQIIGSQAAPPVAGAHVDSPRIQVALKLIHLLAPQPYYGQIAAINLRNLGGKSSSLAPQITLITRFGTQVWWGRAPGQEGFYEVPAARKLESLARIYARFGRIDADRAYVDIRGDQVLVPKPTTQP